MFIFRYGFEALTINHWYGMPLNGTEENPVIGNLNKTAESILSDYSFAKENYWFDITAMIGFIVLFYTIGFIGLFVRVRLNR